MRFFFFPHAAELQLSPKLIQALNAKLSCSNCPHHLLVSPLHAQVSPGFFTPPFTRKVLSCQDTCRHHRLAFFLKSSTLLPSAIVLRNADSPYPGSGLLYHLTGKSFMFYPIHTLSS
jgi:hypothetical protein